MFSALVLLLKDLPILGQLVKFFSGVFNYFKTTEVEKSAQDEKRVSDKLQKEQDTGWVQ